MATFIVSNLAELEAAIATANGNGEDDRIEFDTAGTIRLTSTLHVLADAGHTLTIDGDIDNDGVFDVFITGDVNNDDTTLGGGLIPTDITNISATAASELDDNVQIISAAAGLTLEGLVLTGGVTGSDGGAVSGTNVTLINSWVTGNSAGNGGGIHADTVTLTNSSVSSNIAGGDGGGILATTVTLLADSVVGDNDAGDDGGGIFATTVTLTDSRLTGNSADGDGGGIFATGSASITNSNVSGNSAGGDGGGIYDEVNVNLTDSTVSGNSAGGSGGGIGAVAIASLINSTVSGNSAGNAGGGIAADTANLINSTVSGNSAVGGGGGVGVFTAAHLTNSIVLGNDGFSFDEVVGTFTLSGGNIVGPNVFSGSSLTPIGTTSAGEVFAATVDIGGGVLAGVLADNGGPLQTIALNTATTNPALDAGDDSLAPDSDARGHSRDDVAGASHNGANISDLGAYEVPIPIVVTTLNDVVNASDGFTSLREAIALANDAPGADIISFDASLNGTIRLALGTLQISEELTIDGGGRITISGDVSNDDISTDGLSDVTDIFASQAANKLGDNVQIIRVPFGAFHEGRELTLDGLTLTGGVTADVGGAVNVDDIGITVTLTNSTVSGNSADLGGGGIIAPIINLTNSTVSGNSAGTDGVISHVGGGIFALTAATLVNSTVSGNFSADGGGIFSNEIVTLTNSTVSGNSTLYGGGGISASFVNLTNSTVSGNSTTGFGGGIFALHPLILTNSIVLGNDAVGSTDEIRSETTSYIGLNIVGVGTDVDATDGVINAASVGAVFAAVDGTTGGGQLADNGGPVQTIALKLDASNPALDASNSSAPATDARGEARFDQVGVANANGYASDLGAFELTTQVGFTIIGTKKGDRIDATHSPNGQPKPGDGADTIVGGKGADKMAGGDGEDIFQFNALNELKTLQPIREVVVSRSKHVEVSHKHLSDHIADFTSGEDHLDFANMDADRTTGGHQAFTLIGSSKFSGNAGELRFVNKASGAVVSGDLNGDGKPDFKLLLDHATVAAGDFILHHI